MRLEDLELISEMVARDRGWEEGKLQGKLQGSRESIRELLSLRFGKASSSLNRRIGRVRSVEVLKHLLRRTVFVESLQAFAEEITVASRAPARA